MAAGLGREMMRTGLIVVLVLIGFAALLVVGSIFIKPPPMRPVEAYANISWLAPQNRAFTLDQEAPEVVVLISGLRGWPTSEAEVTFSIISGPASLPAGSERVISDVRGNARTEGLELTGTGTVTIEVSIELKTTQYEFEVTEP